MKQTVSTLTPRTPSLDYLRIFAAMAVVLIHVSGQKWYAADVHELPWQVFNLVDSAVRWGVPVFFMISGALFLGREIPVRKMFSKYILRLATAFVFWSAVYAAVGGGSLKTRVIALIEGHFHMWFILTMIGLYLCLPLLRPIAESRTRTEYFLLLALVFAVVIPQTIALANDFGPGLVKEAAREINNVVAKMNLHFVLGHVGYFLLGYYLSQTQLDRRQRTVVYLLGLCGFAFTVAADAIVALWTGKPCETYYGSFNLNVLLEAAAVFTWFRYRKYENERLNAFAAKLAGTTFGVYLIHPLLLEQLDKRLGINTLSFHPLLSVAAISLAVILVSFAISAILNRIPVVKKYIV